MDKISSILSSTKNQVDMSKERPVRAGAPSFGRPVSKATHTFQKIENEDQMVNPGLALAEKVNSDQTLRHTGIVDKITLSFKGNSERPVEQVIELPDMEIGAEQEEMTPSSPHEEMESSVAPETPSLNLYA